MLLTLPQLITFGLLGVSAATLWLPSGRTRPLYEYVWLLCFALSTACGLGFGFLDARGLLAIAALGCACWIFYRRGVQGGYRMVAGAAVLVISAALATHAAPGFANPRVLSDLVLTPGAAPYSRYLNFDKTAVGLLIIGFGLPRIAGRQEWMATLRRLAPIPPATALAVLPLALGMHYVRFEPAWPPHFALWAATNLLFTCVAEEALFRGFIQKGLESALGGMRWGGTAALLGSSALFGAAHFAGGPRYVLLSAVAGLGYGMAFQRTGRIEAGIVTHFFVNALHYTLFTYPLLATALG